jgi:hypothetical protein
MAGSLKIKYLQIGDNATDSQNFRLSEFSDGTAKLQRGTDGNLGDIWSVSSTGVMTFAAAPVVTAAQSMVKVYGANGYGSTNTAIRRYLNITNGVNGCVIQGTDITVTDSATLGTSFTTNTAGVYSMSTNDQGTGYWGISLNTTTPAATIIGIPVTEMLVVASGGASGSSSCTLYLPAGSILRGHHSTNAGGLATQFIMTKVS